MHRTTVRLPTELLRRARRKAARDGRTLTELIADGLSVIVADGRATPDNEPTVLPRISTASGGLMPGIELEDLQSFEEAEDRRYLARLGRHK